MKNVVLLLTPTGEERAASSSVVQWLRLWASNAGGAISTPGLQAKISHAMCATLSHSVTSDSLQHRGLKPAKPLCPWGFSRQEYWSGLPCPPPGDLPKPGFELRSPALQADSLPPEPLGKRRILKWVAYPSSRGSFQYRDGSQVSHVAGEFFFFFLTSELPGKPRILEWVAYPFSRGSSPPRNGIGISCIAGGFFTS